MTGAGRVAGRVAPFRPKGAVRCERPPAAKGPRRCRWSTLRMATLRSAVLWLAAQFREIVTPPRTNQAPEQVKTRDHVREAFDAAGLSDESVKVGFDEVQIPTAIAQRLIDLYIAARAPVERRFRRGWPMP